MATNNAINISTGISGTVLQGSGVGTAPVFSTSTYPSTNAINTLLYASSANVMAALPTAIDGVLITSHTGVPSLLANGVTGQFLTATTGAPPSWAATGDVTASANLTDNAVIRGDGGAKGVQTSTMLISDAGESTNPSQPAFFATNSATDANVTGDNTTYTIIFNSEVYDQNADYDNTNGQFTAPVTGKYLFCCTVTLDELLVTHTGIFFSIVASNRSVQITSYSLSTGVFAGLVKFSGSTFVDMDAADTCTINTRVAGSTKTVDVYGDADPNTMFCGQLMV